MSQPSVVKCAALLKAVAVAEDAEDAEDAEVGEVDAEEEEEEEVEVEVASRADRQASAWGRYVCVFVIRERR